MARSAALGTAKCLYSELCERDAVDVVGCIRERIICFVVYYAARAASIRQ